ncbi:MAG: hypothetical protein HQM16_12265 [Deltaproteobacteria bacterium]|nr:hypothetical protein [Deltaproteobacteria bacterium]
MADQKKEDSKITETKKTEIKNDTLPNPASQAASGITPKVAAGAVASTTAGTSSVAAAQTASNAASKTATGPAPLSPDGESNEAKTAFASFVDHPDISLTRQNSVWFAAIIVGAILATTLLYWAVTATANNTKTAGPVEDNFAQAALATNSQNTVQTGQGQGAFIAGGQYICPACGHTGLPHFDTNGVPHCPLCGNQMSVNNGTVGNQVALACPGGVCPPGGCLRAAPVAFPCAPGAACPGTAPVAFNCPAGGNCLLPGVGTGQPAAFNCPTGGNCLVPGVR